MKQYMFFVVGVGGTGSLLARDLPKLLTGTKSRIYLIDGDVVEKKNIIRQGYQEQDIGINKAISLSKKINSLYKTECLFLDQYITFENISHLVEEYSFKYTPVILGCVDNDATRKVLEKLFKYLDDCIYIDSANSEYEGNVYITTKKEGKIYGKLRSQVYKFSKDKNPGELSCQEEAAKGNVQFLVTNARMATTILEHCNALISNELKEGVQIVNRFETVFYN